MSASVRSLRWIVCLAAVKGANFERHLASTHGAAAGLATSAGGGSATINLHAAIVWDFERERVEAVVGLSQTVALEGRRRRGGGERHGRYRPRS